MSTVKRKLENDISFTVAGEAAWESVCYMYVSRLPLHPHRYWAELCRYCGSPDIQPPKTCIRAFHLLFRRRWGRLSEQSFRWHSSPNRRNSRIPERVCGRLQYTD